MSTRDAAQAVEAVLDTIAGTLRREGSITLAGFGRFATSTRAARNGVEGADALAEAAAELRFEAEELGRSHERFTDRIETSRRKLREIVGAA